MSGDEAGRGRKTPTLSPRPLRDGDQMAAIDIGSNSFHMVVARYTLGQLRVLDRLREMVRMAEGLDADGGLRADVHHRALACLSRFGQRIADIPPHRVRAVATNSVRQLAAPQAFLMPAETALGHAIEVVSGREEARLVYLGVAHAHPPRRDQLRLVIDIGGGSTECIIGSGAQALERESLQMGSVATTRRFFGNGRLTRKRWKEALLEVSLQFQQFAAAYRAMGWDDVMGSSGTIKAVGEICAAMKLTKGAITAEALPQVRDRLLTAGRIEQIDLPGLSPERKPIIAGGVLILEAAFDVLGMRCMQVSKAAMREGVLYDMLGRGSALDPRAGSIAALERRYGIDTAQGGRVQATALRLFDQAAPSWKLDTDMRALLGWAARLHELGLAIAHSQYHLHSAYVLEHSDIAGFSRGDQAILAALVRSHRRKVGKNAFSAIPDRLLSASKHTAALLRLAVLLHRSHEAASPPEALRLRVRGDTLRLRLPETWLADRPLLQADLLAEPEEIAALGIKLTLLPD